MSLSTHQLILQFLQGIPVAFGSQFGLFGPCAGVHMCQLGISQLLVKLVSIGSCQLGKSGNPQPVLALLSGYG